jgi:hypothetical protein
LPGTEGVFTDARPGCLYGARQLPTSSIALVNAGEEAAAVEDQCSVLPRLVFFVLF